MNISKDERRVLHVQAQGGGIRHLRAPKAKIRAAQGVTREGLLLVGCDRQLSDRLRRRRFIRSTGGQPYRVTRAGLAAVCAQRDNRQEVRR